MKKQSLFVIISVSILAICMNVVDLFIQPGYFVKSAIKAIMFFGVPLVYFSLQKEGFKELKAFLTPKPKGIVLSLILGIVAYSFIVFGYLLLKDVIDFSNITKSLTGSVGVHAGNFLYVSLYICICNSFLEEFLFRGFAFLTLKKLTGNKLACCFSACIFAFYHIGMTFGWVSFPAYVGGFIGLVLGGLIFNYLDLKSETIYCSWIVHIFINLGINTVGFMLFGIL